MDQIAELLANVRDLPVTRGESPAQIRAVLGDDRLPERGAPPDDVLDQATRLLMEHSALNGHPRFWGFITASPAPLGMLGDLLGAAVNPNVGLLFIALHGRPARLRVNGTARVSRDDPLLGEAVGAQLIVRVAARAIFPNCPRYIPKMELVEPSAHVPQPGCDPPEPAWKNFEAFKDAVHPRQATFKG